MMQNLHLIFKCRYTGVLEKYFLIWVIFSKLGDSMLNGVQEKGLNVDFSIKVQKFPGASSTDMLDHIRPSLKKEPDQIIIYAGTNDLTNDHNYLNDVKKIVKMVRETCKNTKLCFSPMIWRTDRKDIDKKVKKN